MSKKPIYFNVAAVLLAATLLGYAGDWYWAFDLFAHFRELYLLLAAIVLIVSLASLQRFAGFHILLMTCLLVNTIAIAPFYYSKIENTASSEKIKIVSINLNRFNDQTELLKKYLAESNPDCVAFFELTPDWAKYIRTLSTDYPYAKAILQNDNFGIGVISKYPLNNTQSSRDQIFNIPFISVEMLVKGLPFTLVAVHPFPPLGSDGTKSRNSYLKRVSDFIASKSGLIVLCGDMNTTQFNNTFDRLQKESGLVLPKGFGIVGTWPSRLSPATIPIDHCLFSKDLRVITYRRGENIGSDHYPIEVEFSRDVTRATAGSKN